MQRQTLLTLTAAAGVMFCFSARGAIDFNRLYRIAEAERIFGRKDFVEARAEFKDLAGSASDPVEQAVLAARAAIALGCQDGQYESALAEVARIKNQPVADYARITLLTSKSDWAGIVEQFGDAPIADWPVVRLPARPQGAVEDLRAYGLVKRAEASEKTGAYRQAEQDLAMAVDIISGGRFLQNTLVKLAALRQNRLNDPDGAYEINMRIATMEVRGNAAYYRGVLNAMTYLRQNGRNDEAVVMILSLQHVHAGSWQGQFLSELERSAGALVDAGRIAEVVAAYRHLLGMKGITEEHREQAETAIRELQGAE